MNTPPPSRGLHKEPSRLAIEKNEWRKHAEKVQARESKRNGDDKKNGNGSKKDSKPESHNRKLRWQRGKLQQGGEDGESQFPKNEYHSTHYTWWNFIPKNLYEQFRRFTNLYFLLVTLLTLTPFSPIPPYTSILPLVIVLTISAVSSAIEDIRRWKSDKKVNSAPYYVLEPGGRWNPTEVKSADLRVGSLLYLESGDSLPADAVLLRSSAEDGRCFLQTTQLDGETNLKPHHAPECLQKKPREQVAALDATMEVGEPTASFTFSGSLSVSGEDKMPLNYGNFLARGTLLRNTDWVVAAVVYSGNETKMSLNVRPPPLKFSSLDKRMNRVVIVLFTFMFSLIVAVVLSSFFFEQAASPEKWYLLNPTGRANDPLWLIIMRRFVAYFVLLSFIVPQSLMVMLDLCKAGQAAFIQWDERMPGAVAKSIGVNDELGRVQFLFSDKTGTLTVNKMRFRQASVGGKFYDSEAKLKQEVEKEGTKGPVYDMLLSVALCHDAIAVPANDKKKHKSEKRLDPSKVEPEDVDEDEDEDDAHQEQGRTEGPEPQVSKSGLLHRSSSPDEEALLRAAARLGFELLENKPQEVAVKIRDRDIKMQKLAVIPFSSARKRMSVIVRLDNGRTRLICKGADSAVLPRLKGGSSGVHEVTEHVERMAVESGLRTLVVAGRDLTQQQLDSWLAKWQDAQGLTDEEEKNRRSNELSEEIEREMDAVGATGIEDRLQSGVPRTIASLREAGIRVWVITGDKPETAINIGYSCNLLHRSMTLCRVPQVANSARDVSSALRECFSRERSSNGNSEPALSRALVISGEQITVAMREAPDALLEAVLESAAVLACRVTPLQKAELVDFVRQQTGATTLSIGDGANDVPMIHAGNIGVGIFGREGTQAVSASDFAVRRFRDLRPLLFVHGRNALLRNSTLIQFQIYKNMAFFLPQVWFALWCGFSSMTLYEAWIMTFFNLLFTSLPPLFVGLFERDLPRHIQETHPEVYPELRSNWIFGYWTLALWFLRGLFDSTLVFYFAMLTWMEDGILPHGRSAGLTVMGNTIAIAALLIVLARMAIETKTWNILLVFGYIWSVISFVGMFAAENWIWQLWPEMYGSVTHVVSPAPVLCILLAFVVCAGSEFFIPVLRRAWRPDKRHILLEATRAYEARGLQAFPSEGDSRTNLFA